jgi:glycosyltransferase involved in cell wall biosynthesis
VASVGERLAALRRSQTGREVAVISNGVRSLKTSRKQPDEARPFTLIYVGNVVDWSGLDAMLAALPEVLATGLRLRVLILGDGLPSYVAALHQQVQDASLQDTVQFVGRVPNEQIGDWLSQADVGLAHFRPEPYRRYAFPLKVVEYMAAGLAIIGTQHTETEDILQRHHSGISVAFDSHAIAQAVLRFAREPELLQRCRQSALQAAPQYLWSVLTARELALAEHALMKQHLHRPDKQVAS